MPLTDKKRAAIQLETERLTTSKVKVNADANSYEIAKKASGGITPEVQLKMKLKRNVKIAAKNCQNQIP